MKKILLATALSMASVSVFAAACEATIEGNDAMQYNLKEITVDGSCTEFKLTLKHVGKMPKAAMGHNWSLVKTADVKTVTAAAAKAGPKADYIPAEGVIVHTKMLGGGETDTITFALDKLEKGGDYTYICTFPGHAPIMHGKFIYK